MNTHASRPTLLVGLALSVLAAHGVLAADEPPSAPSARLDAGVQVQDVGGRRVIADSQSLTWRTGAARPTRLTVTDLSPDEAANIERINATRGTYQSYLLATREDLPTRLFHPGFTITLPPPRKRAPPPEEEPLAPPAPPPPPAR